MSKLFQMDFLQGDNKVFPLIKSEFIKSIILENLITGRIEPGTHITQQDLAKEFNVSVTPVREALRNLEAQGVLTYEQHHGVRVSVCDRNTANEVYRARSGLEGIVIQEAVRHIDEFQISRLENIATRIIPKTIVQGVKQRNFQAFRKANFDFHELFVVVSGMQLIGEIIRSLWARTPTPGDFFIKMQDRANEAVNEHIELLKAVRENDGEKARRLMETHIDHAREAYLKYLDSTEP